MPFDLAGAVVARWNDPDPKHVDLLRQAGIEGVVLGSAAAGISGQCKAAGIQTILESEIEWLPVKNLNAAPSGKPVVLVEGSWPGVAREPNVPGRGDETASASREPWVEFSGYWAAY